MHCMLSEWERIVKQRKNGLIRLISAGAVGLYGAAVVAAAVGEWLWGGTWS